MNERDIYYTPKTPDEQFRESVTPGMIQGYLRGLEQEMMTVWYEGKDVAAYTEQRGINPQHVAKALAQARKKLSKVDKSVVRELLPIEEVDKPKKDVAACIGEDPDLFFAPNRDVAAQKRAKRICQSCPIIKQCLDEALQDSTLEGILGGTTDDERKAIRRKSRR